MSPARRRPWDGMRSLPTRPRRRPPHDEGRQLARASIVRVDDPAVGREQFELHPARDEAFDAIQHIDNMMWFAGDTTDPDGCPAVQPNMIDFGDTDLKPASQFGDHRAHQGTLFLDRVHIAEQQVELDPTDPHAAILASAPGARRRRSDCTVMPKRARASGQTRCSAGSSAARVRTGPGGDSAVSNRTVTSPRPAPHTQPRP